VDGVDNDPIGKLVQVVDNLVLVAGHFLHSQSLVVGICRSKSIFLFPFYWLVSVGVVARTRFCGQFCSKREQCVNVA